MAIYTDVVSLMQDLEPIISSYGHIVGYDQGFRPITKQDIEILYNAVSLMDSFLRDSSGESYNPEFMDQMLEKRIRDVVHEAGNCVDFLLVSFRRRPTLKRLRGYPALTEVTEEIVSINEELKKIRDNREVQDLDITSSTGKSSTFSSPSRRRSNTEGKLVGLEKDLVTMLDSLTGQPSHLKVLSIIGMGGIGKTTLSRKLYDNPLVIHHFYVRVWVTVSQQYQVRELLLGVLRCIINVPDEICGRSNEELRERVYRILKGKRYLIVLDDMWDTKAWDELKRTFPDDKNGSRIMLTSRLRDVAVHASQDTPPHCLLCLSIHESWELLSSKIFVDESCPLELVEIGKQIAYKCQGLPLALVVVGGLLSKMNKKLDVWEEVARSVGSLLIEEAEDCQNILALSYNHMPDHLKACFLYMGVFPEDYEISVKKLIWLWIAEGFIRPGSLKSLEEVAEDCIEDLTARSLILVKRTSSDGRIKTCYIHDLMRELCLRESQKQNFLRVISSCGHLPLVNLHGDPLPNFDIRQVSPIYLHNQQRLSFHSGICKYFHQKIDLPHTPFVMGFKKLVGLEKDLLTTLDSLTGQPSRRTSNTKDTLVGLEKDLVTMLDSLTGQPSHLKVLSIIGMGGIGKTTLSRKLYDNPLVIHHFYVRVWVTISQQCQVRELLLGVLQCVINVSDEICGRSNEELREQVYRILKGKRYLIVLDDMWDTKAWDELKRTFPDDKNGSRIMLTSRLRDVAVHASQDTPPHCLLCLSIHESWELLSSKIFLDESCPLELVEIGKQIAYNCKGLPLALVVVGGLLSKMNKKLDVWEEVARSVGSLLIEAEDCQNILALSYNHLPDHLKACFLYMGVFLEGYEISVKKLIWLWIAKGFIRPSSLKSLEEVAEDCIEDLTARSLILVKRTSSDGSITTCYIHDLMRELCLRESQKQNFLHVMSSCGQLPLVNLHGYPLPNFDIRHVSPNYLHNKQRLSFYSGIRKYFHQKNYLPYTRSVMCFEKLSLSDPRSDLSMNFERLKVLDLMNIRLSVIPGVIQNLTLLKFVALTIENSSDIMSLFRFCRLQTLILDCEWDGHLPRIFWDMLQLRHFHLKRSFLSYSPNSSGLIISQSPSTLALEVADAKLPLRVLNNLKSVSTIRPISCTKTVFLSMPHLKKLGVHVAEEDYQFRGWFKELVHLGELETLKYVFSNPFVSSVRKPDRLPSWDSFPPKLVKLTLSGTSLPWEDMLKLSMLPKLEVLKLRNYAFSGAVWKSRKGGFTCLKFLLIGSTNLEIWVADGTHFPNLQRLVLRHCRSLKEIPYGIGEAPLLENIELHCCKDSAVISARHLQEEQQSLGNDGLTIHVTGA